MSRKALWEGTLIGEPRFSTPCEMRFSHARKGKRPFQRETLDKCRFKFSRGKHRVSQGVDNRGSLISVPLALRELSQRFRKGVGERGFATDRAPPNPAKIVPQNRVCLLLREEEDKRVKGKDA